MKLAKHEPRFIHRDCWYYVGEKSIQFYTRRECGGVRVERLTPALLRKMLKEFTPKPRKAQR